MDDDTPTPEYDPKLVETVICTLQDGTQRTFVTLEEHVRVVSFELRDAAIRNKALKAELDHCNATNEWMHKRFKNLLERGEADLVAMRVVEMSGYTVQCDPHSFPPQWSVGYRGWHGSDVSLAAALGNLQGALKDVPDVQTCKQYGGATCVGRGEPVPVWVIDREIQLGTAPEDLPLIFAGIDAQDVTTAVAYALTNGKEITEAIEAYEYKTPLEREAAPMPARTLMSKIDAGEFGEDRDAIATALDDAIDAWHEHPRAVPDLEKFLGLTWEEFKIWHDDRISLLDIARRRGDKTAPLPIDPRWDDTA